LRSGNLCSRASRQQRSLRTLPQEPLLAGMSSACALCCEKSFVLHRSRYPVPRPGSLEGTQFIYLPQAHATQTVASALIDIRCGRKLTTTLWKGKVSVRRKAVIGAGTTDVRARITARTGRLRHRWLKDASGGAEPGRHGLRRSGTSCLRRCPSTDACIYQNFIQMNFA